MQKEAVEFSNDRGELLRGDLYRPAGPARAVALFAHCFTCASNFKAPVRISRALCRAGFAVLAFDFTGLGRSGGEFSATNFTTNIADLVAAARYLESAASTGPGLIVGHSLGGTAALAAAERIASVKAIATIAAPARAAEVRHLLGASVARIETAGEGTVDIGGRPFLIKKQLLDDLERYDVPRNLQALGHALLIMHSPADAVVSIENAIEIFRQAAHPKSIVSLDDADHLLSRERDAAYAAAVLAAWSSRYLDETTRPREGEDEIDAVIARTGAEGFVTDIDAGGHELVADEPVSVGGTGLGPTPYELLAAALASCTSMTLQMYARRKRLPLTEAAVAVRYSRIHAADCATCENKEGKVDRFDRELELSGDLDDAARGRLLEIAERCPIHKTLEGSVSIRTTLRSPPGGS